VGVAWHWAGNGPPTLDWPHLVVLSLLGVVASLWLLQIGLTRTSPVAAMAIMSTLPVISYVTEMLQGSAQVSWPRSVWDVVLAVPDGGARDEQRDPDPKAGRVDR
jgi:drug/metabolite transporter (DMT)-like permease